VGQQIRKIRAYVFIATSSEVERGAWRAFKAVTTNFLRSSKVENYESFVELVKAYRVIRCKMSLRINFLDSHLKLFHQEISMMEKQYQGKWSPRCVPLTLVRDAPEAKYKL
jgi:hypothetical protein